MSRRATTRQNIWPFGSRATSSRMTMPASARSAGALGIGERKHRATSKKIFRGETYKGVKITPTDGGEFALPDGSWFETVTAAKRFIDKNWKRNPGPLARWKRRKVEKRTGKALKRFLNEATKRKNPGQFYAVEHIPSGKIESKHATQAAAAKERDRLNAKTAGYRETYRIAQYNWNPAESAASAYEEFHGKAPDEFVEVTERVHYHKHLSGAGQLRKLIVAAIDGRHIVTLSQFGGALLAFNERKNQLFVKGGDQAVDLKDFGIDPRKAHELETLGRVKSIDYKTDKRHLGDEGGKATYRHKFRTTNEDGRHVTIRIARYPDLIYRVRDEALEFSGGSYEIIAEGIDR